MKPLGVPDVRFQPSGGPLPPVVITQLWKKQIVFRGGRIFPEWDSLWQIDFFNATVKILT